MSGMQRNGQRRNFTPNNNNARFGQNQNRQNFNRNKKFGNNRPMRQGVKTINGLNGNREAIIARNLEHMKQVAQKKLVAQAKYYDVNGRSPMVKQSQQFIKHDAGNRLSVRQRLGNTQNRTNNNFTPKKTFPNRQFIGGFRSDKLVRVQTFQQKRQRFRNHGNAIKTISATGKVVYLEPVRKPANYTVRVDNDRKQTYKHHVQKDLDPVIQEEIKLIQSRNVRQVITPTPPVTAVISQTSMGYESFDRLPPTATTRTLHERFSMI